MGELFLRMRPFGWRVVGADDLGHQPADRIGIDWLAPSSCEDVTAAVAVPGVSD